MSSRPQKPQGTCIMPSVKRTPPRSVGQTLATLYNFYIAFWEQNVVLQLGLSAPIISSVL